MRSPNARGFTLIEVLIAAALTAVLAAAAFATLSTVQRISGASAQAAAMGSEGRVALDIMGRDIRGAGDSLDLGVAACLPGVQANSNGISPCPAILEPHPWRVTIARRVWNDANGDISRFSANDTPAFGGQLTDEPQNVVAYEFVPDNFAGGALAMRDCAAGAACQVRQVWLGRIDRVSNPFGFLNQAPLRSVLVDNVFLDDALTVEPIANPPVPDPRSSFSLFMYQVAYRPNELQTGAVNGARPSVTGTLISPPLRFFAFDQVPTDSGSPQGFPTLAAAAPRAYMGANYTPEIVGFNLDGSAVGGLLAVSQGGSLVGTDTNSDLRYLIDRNRFRTVRVTFKVHAGRDAATGLPEEEQGYTTGLDVDGNRLNGTARFTAFQATFELKTLATNALQYETAL